MPPPAPLVYATPATWDGFWYIALAEQFRGSLGDVFANLPDKVFGQDGLLERANAQFGLLALAVVPAFIVAALRAPRYTLLSVASASSQSILITPTVSTSTSHARPRRGVDPRRCANGSAARPVRRRLGRQLPAFHTLDRRSLRSLESIDATLLLIGDGPNDRTRSTRSPRRGVTPVFTGTVSHPDLPRAPRRRWTSARARGRDRTFHYSPLKLAEYLAAGTDVAPDVPQIAARLTDDVDAYLMPPGDAAGACARVAPVARRARDPGPPRHRGARRGPAVLLGPRHPPDPRPVGPHPTLTTTLEGGSHGPAAHGVSVTVAITRIA